MTVLKKSDALATLAPRLARAHAAERAEQMRGISHCGIGWHVYGAGPCFDTRERALDYRDGLDREGITWRPQR